MPTVKVRDGDFTLLQCFAENGSANGDWRKAEAGAPAGGGAAGQASPMRSRKPAGTLPKSFLLKLILWDSG